MKRVFCSACFFGVFCLFLSLISPTVYGAEKVITLRFAYFFPSTMTRGKMIEGWGKELEKRTNGRVIVKYYPAETLLPATQMYDGVTKEMADCGLGIFAYHRGRFPLTEVIDLPLQYRSSFAPTGLINAYYKKFKPKELDDVKVLFLEASSPGIVNTKKPIAKLEDLKGMKLRATGLSAKIVSALGATAVGIPIPETYDALSKGVAEGLMIDLGGLWNYNLGDVVKNHVMSYGVTYSTAFYVVMNKEKWNSLPADIQAIIDKLNEDWIKVTTQVWMDWQDNGISNLKKKGNKFIDLPKEEHARWAERTKPILDDYVKATTAKGLPGAEALKFCQDYLKEYDK